MKKVVGGIALLLVFCAVYAAPAKAWDCSGYNFGVEANGTVWVENTSGSNEPAQQADVFINAALVNTFSVPVMPAGTGRTTIGSVPVHGGDTWRVRGTDDCEDSGTLPLDPPPPDDPPPPGNTLICVTIDKGDLWGKLEIWHSNEAGDRLDGFDGYAEINNDGALTVFANPGESRNGWFLVNDEHGTMALFYIQVGMVVDCASPLNHDCRRIYPQAVERNRECDCDA